MTLLELAGLSAGYGAVKAVRHLDLVVNEGAFVVLLGPNGAGKSTTMRTVSGLLAPTAGRVSFDGVDITRRAGWRRVAMGLGHVPEGRQIFPDHTVHDNLLLGGFAQRGKGTIDDGLAHMYELFPRLAERRRSLGGTLSGGEAQMLAVARALMSRPKLLMLDEPSLGLAPIMVAELFDYLNVLHRQENLAILLVEQQARTALQLADYGYVLDRGAVAAEGTGAQLRADSRVKSAYLGG